MFRGQGKRFEIWHDYISVPQWQAEVKRAIIQKIPQIFERAMLTTAYLSDLDAANISAMREGRTSTERCRGISNICNAKWFSRVWTAMEFTRSPNICFMTKDFILVNKHLHGISEQHLHGTSAHHDLVEELEHKWSTEIGEDGSATRIEALVGMGYNLVP